MRKIKSINHLLPIFILLIVFVGGISVYYRQYSNTINIIKSEYAAKSRLVEESIYNETKYTEILSKIAEKDFDKKMENFSDIMLKKYQLDEDVLNWNFEDMKKQFEGMDIYIIDKDLEVIASTVDEDVGINFSGYSSFGQKLKDRLNKNKFESDTINFSIKKGDLKKYSYISTPDNKYLLELSLSIKNNYPELENLNILYLSKNLRDNYEFVEDIRIYKYNKDNATSKQLEVTKGYSGEDIFLKYNENYLIKKALSTNLVQEQKIKDKDDISYTAKYIPYTIYNEEEKLEWWDSYVIQVLYNDQVIMSDMSRQKILFIRTMIIMSIVYFSLSTIILYLIQKNKSIAYKDYLTKLPNRIKFDEVIESKIVECNKRGTKFAVLFFDLDKFKQINDTLGHTIGDKVLKEVAIRIKQGVPRGNIVSRLGGDEFIALLSNVKTKKEVDETVTNILKLFENPINIDSNEIFINTSIGVSIYPDHGISKEQLIEKADKAMYHYKINQIDYNL